MAGATVPARLSRRASKMATKKGRGWTHALGEREGSDAQLLLRNREEVERRIQQCQLRVERGEPTDARGGRDGDQD